MLKIATMAWLTYTSKWQSDFAILSRVHVHETSHMQSVEKIRLSRIFPNLQYTQIIDSLLLSVATSHTDTAFAGL